MKFNLNLSQFNSSLDITFDENDLIDNYLETINIFRISSSKSFLAIVFVICLIITLIISILLNAITIVSIVMMKKYKKIDFLILNLAFADLVYSMNMPLFIAYVFNASYEPGLRARQLFYLADSIGMNVSAYTVVALSFERFTTVVETNSLWIKFFKSSKNVYTLIYLLATWLLSALFIMPFIFSLKQDWLAHEEKHMCYTEWSERQINIFFSLRFVAIFAVPYIIISIFSIKLLRFLSDWNKRLQARSIETISLRRIELNNMNVTSLHLAPVLIAHKPSYNKKIHNKSTRSVLIIMILFCIQWLPFWIVQILINLTGGHKSLLHMLVQVTICITYTNSISNPVLYMLMSSNFQKFCKKIFKRK